MTPILEPLRAGIIESLQDTWILMPNWKWVGLVVLVFLGATLLPLIRPLLLQVKSSLQKTFLQDSWPAFLLKLPIEKNLSWVLIFFFWHVGLRALGLPDFLDHLFSSLNLLVLALALIGLGYQASDAAGQVLLALIRKTAHAETSQLVPFVTKTLKVLVVVLGVLLTMQGFGINVVSILAGLGLGGLALALAAQDTAANFFGSLMILADRPFKVGDLVRIGDTLGTIEEIGFRSTRIRTLENSLVTLPNATVAKEKVENLQDRISRRIRFELGLTYNTPSERVSQFCATLKEVIKAQPDFVTGTEVVSLQKLADYSLVIVVQGYFHAQQPGEDLAVTERLLFASREIAERLSVQFAFPTQTLELRRLD